MKKILALILALAMILAVGAAFATDPETPPTTKTTVTKVEGVTGPASITVNIPSDVAAQAVTNTYKIYKVFDATSDGTSSNIAYTSRQGETMPSVGFVLDAQGNIHHGTKDATTGEITENTATELTAEEIAAIKAYVREADLVATVVVEGAVTTFTVSELPYGYYYITTTTGTVVTVDSTNPNASVNDKNSPPSLDKTITGGSDDTIDEAGKNAIAQVGSTVNYKVEIEVGAGMKNYTFHDKMSDGLEFVSNSLTVTGKKSKTDNTAVTVTYTVKGTPEGEDTFTVDFGDGLPAGTVITVSYQATVTNAALTVDYENNTAYLDYGDENSHNKTPEDETKVYAAKITVIKVDDENKPLSGAKFKLKKSNTEWYKLTTTDGKSTVTWVAENAADEYEVTAVYDKDDPTKVIAYEAVFQGLPAGTYTLVETVVPAGYNKAADTSITVKAADKEDAFTEANLEQEATVVNKSGTELPSTGGIGTTIFYVVGGLLVLGAAIILVTRRKAESK